VLIAGDEVRHYPTARAQLDANGGRAGEWELVHALGDALIIAGSTPRNVCHAALAWIANPARETGRLSRFRFTDRFTMWDNTMNQMYRFSQGFDRAAHIRELARLGLTGLESTATPDAGGWHVRNRRFPQDPYPCI